MYEIRIDRFINHVADRILSDSVTFEATYARCPDAVSFDKRLKLKYQPISERDLWGQAWDSAWFHLKGEVPESWKERKVVAHLDLSGEGLVFNPAGDILQGITNGSVFKEDFARDIVPLFEKCEGGEAVELWVEATANGLFGVITESDPAEDSPKRYGYYEAKVNTVRLAIFDEALWKLWLDLKILNGLVKALPEGDVRRQRIIRTVNGAIDVFADTTEGVRKCREILKQELEKPASASDLSVAAIGHAHIDTAWLWPVRETIRKCARTFSNQIALIEQYPPDYIFGASSPQHYAFVKDHYPAIYSEIKKLVKAGRWELLGGMWVEADCNLISGESMIRQILYGKNFFLEEFGVDVDTLWIPDVFGYTASMPQIMRKSGMKYFLTQKLSWNQVNEFPHHTFKWRGIGGSEMLVHFPPEDTYNSMLGSDSLVPAQRRFKEKGSIDEFLSVFGVGDGGGGPKEENIEMGLRMKNLEGTPQVRFGRVDEFFKRLEKAADRLETWVGELYLEAHRGTLTTHADVKRANRKLEHRLKALEFFLSCSPKIQYPAEKLAAIWKKVLINQFHDILPGSSITKVYEDTHRDYDEASKGCEALLREAASVALEKRDESLVLFNCLHYPFDDPIQLPDGWENCEVESSVGQDLIVQCENNRAFVLTKVPPYSFKTLKKLDKAAPESKAKSSLILENDLVRYVFDRDGTLKEAFDKQANRAILADGERGNLLTLYDDHPHDFDAWEIDLSYENCVIETAKSVEADTLPKGPICQGLRFRLSIGGSRIEQTVRLASNSKRLDFETTVDWSEKHKMLRVSFPVNVASDRASFDIPYGYLMRNTHRNTSWDEAKFEVAGQRYADLSGDNYGVALLNDCKYGYKVLGNVLDLNLLRAPTYPDPDADQGQHRFNYSLLPHTGDLIRSSVMAEAAKLNQDILMLPGFEAAQLQFPIKLEGEGVSLETVKKAEKEDCLILRIVETLGRHSPGVLSIENRKAVLVETNLMEWEDGKAISCETPVDIKLNPFEIRTYKLKTT